MINTRSLFNDGEVPNPMGDHMGPSGVMTLADNKAYKQTQAYLDNLCSLPWTHYEAVNIIQELQEFAHSCGYHICLGGGVLNKGVSYNDLDLIIITGESLDIHKKETIIKHICKEMSLHTSYEFDSGCKHVRRCVQENTQRRVDLVLIHTMG